MVFDVIVAGGGPVGMLLACELGLAGVSVLVIDRERVPDRAHKSGPLGARSINAPSADAFHRRGLLDAVKRAAAFWYEPDAGPGRPAGRKPAGGSEAGPSPAAFVGHFAGIMLHAGRIDFSDPDLSRHTLGGGVIHQYAIESILRERAAELGVELRCGTSLLDFEADAAGVSVEAGGERLRARWLVGCDGGRSTVRKRAGFDFPGTEPEQVGRQAIVDTIDGLPFTPGGWVETGLGSYVYGPVPFASGPAPIRLHVVEFGRPACDRDAPVTPDEMETSLFRVSGIRVKIARIHAAVRYTDNTRQVPKYRNGRVLLAGDAAHVHWPAGGQGLNLGIGDAMNLGWKLAATVQGWAPDGLLDTYTAERHPIGASVQDWSNAQAALGRLDPRSRALRAIVADLLDSGPASTYVLKRIAGVSQRYDLPGNHPLIGRPAPDLTLDDGSSLAERGRDGSALLVDLAGCGGLRELAGRWGRRIRVVTACHASPRGLSALFVRPDGYVAWAGIEGFDLADAEASIRTWLGDPEPPVESEGSPPD